MNLNFFTVGETETHLIQKANVTANGEFWRAWTFAKAEAANAALLGCQEPEKSLASLITLKREKAQNEDHWFAYRLHPKIQGEEPATFPLSYSVSNTSKLLPYQPKAVAYLCNSIVSHGAALDGSDTGIGKTYIALAVARELKYHPAIVCKKAGIAGWKKACAFFDITPLFIVNWELAKSDRFPFANRIASGDYGGPYGYRWKIPNNTILIFDEAHSANNMGSQNTALYMSSRGIPSIACSATIADRPSRLRPLLHVLGAVPSSKFDTWLSERSSGFINERSEVSYLCDTEEMLSFNKMLYPRYGYRLSFEDPEVKQYFPEAVYQTEIISIGTAKEKEQNALYDQMIEKVEYYKSLGKQADKMVAELRYRQATELLKADALVELTQDFIMQRHSVCIFVNYKETLAYLAKKLHTQSLIFGEQEKYGYSREQVIETFQENKTNLIICMADAGGQSISLHDLHGGHPRISLICPTYDSVKLKQILGRTYRAGSKTTPIMKLVYAAGTIEEKVAETVNRRLAYISALNDGDLMEPDLFKLGG